MDYETADGSQFSLREVWSEDYDQLHTMITAFVEGKAYVGKSLQRMEEMDEADVLQILESIPVENIFPLMPKSFTLAPPFDVSKHYLKAPQFTYDDRLPGNTFVADCLLREAAVLETLVKQPHPSIVKYFGCVVKEERISHLCLQRCLCNLTELRDMGATPSEQQRLLDEIRQGIEHLHNLGLAHNDINPDNICIDHEGRAVIVDFDSCTPIGEPITKGATHFTDNVRALSSSNNDFRGLKDIENFLLSTESTP